jgi:hypothetical protein
MNENKPDRPPTEEEIKASIETTLASMNMRAAAPYARLLQRLGLKTVKVYRLRLLPGE